jgi:hypothetical protein
MRRNAALPTRRREPYNPRTALCQDAGGPRIGLGLDPLIQTRHPAGLIGIAPPQLECLNRAEKWRKPRKSVHLGGLREHQNRAQLKDGGQDEEISVPAHHPRQSSASHSRGLNAWAQRRNAEAPQPGCRLTGGLRA